MVKDTAADDAATDHAEINLLHKMVMAHFQTTFTFLPTQ